MRRCQGRVIQQNFFGSLPLITGGGLIESIQNSTRDNYRKFFLNNKIIDFKRIQLEEDVS